ncbi:MAG: putative F420-dependent oxidoreductase [Myxococcota bacterium]|jgi:probable F420-dependent oxidoreductase
MRFGYLETMTDPAFMRPLALAAEEAGYDSFVVPDSVCYPEHSDSKYPYTQDGGRQFLEDKPFVETFALISYLSAITERIHFTTSVVKLPLRHPVLMAKQLSSVALLSNNRLSLGVGISPWPDDFEAVDVEWKGRGKRLDEMIDIIRGLCAGGFFAYEGEVFQVPSLKICPVPTEPFPIIIGGHSEPALKRAVRTGDGWIHAGGDTDELDPLLARVNELRREYGKENDPFQIHVISMDSYTPDGIRRLEDKGITDVMVGFRNSYTLAQDPEPLEKKVSALRRYSDKVISNFR